MTMKTKMFDCVDMKRKAQRKLRAEYASRTSEFPSYVAFLEAKASESPWQRDFWERIEAAKNEQDVDLP